MPQVSIILPNYNHCVYLKQRIDSILNQTYQDFELIILDDKSTDNSPEVIESYRDHPRVSSIIINEINSGSTFIQWEKGIKISTGEYIWIAESDDWSNPDFLMRMINLLKENENAALAFSQSYFIDEKNEILFSGTEGVDEIWRTNVFLTTQQALKQFIWHTQIVNASSVVFRKHYYSLIRSKEYISFKHCGDWLFWIKLLEHGGLIYENDTLNYFRQHTNNVRSKNSTNGAEVLERLKIYNYFQTNFKELITYKERNKFEENLKFNLYIKICYYLKGEKVLLFNNAIVKSLFTFPRLFVLLPSLILLNFIKKISIN